MRKIYFTLLVLFFIASAGFAQNADNKDTKKDKGKVVQNDYSRNALSVVVLDFANDKYSADLKTAWDKLIISDKYDNNQVEVKSLKANFDMRLGNCAGGGAAAALLAKKDTSRPSKMLALLNERKMGHLIIDKWFEKTADGTVSLETIFKRGQYNATDADYKNAMNSERKGAALKDAGYNLINNSYIVVIDFGNIMTMEEYYDQMEANKKLLNSILKTNMKQKRPKTGYITDIKAYLFKVDYSADVNQAFFDLFQEIKGDDQHWKIDKSKYDAMNIPMKFVAQVSFPRVQGNEYKTGHILAPATPSTKEQLFVKLVNDGFESAGMMLTRKVEAFRVKSPIAEAKKSFIFPNVKSKVGKKEGIKLDARYFAWEKVEENGKVVSKRRGVVRASNDIVDNRTSTTGSTGLTKFYQISGKKLEDGMTLEERPDFGLGLFVGAGLPMANISTITTTTGYYDGSYNWIPGGTSTIEYTPALAIQGRLEYNVSPIVAKVTKKFFTEFRLFVEARILGEVSTDVNGKNLSTIQQSNLFYGGGISKDIHLTRKIKLAPFAQYMIGSYNTLESAAQIGFGARLPINFNYWLSFVPSVTMFTPFEGTYKSEFSGLGGMYVDFGLRIGI